MQQGATEEGIQATEGNNTFSRSPVLKGLTPGSSKTASLASAKPRAQDSLISDTITRNYKSIQGCESIAGWETSTSESITSASRTTSGSRTAMSFVQLSRSYMDGVFTMDMEKTPKAAASSIFGPYGDASKGSASSLLAGTPMSNEQNTIKRDHYRYFLTGEPTVVAEGSMVGGDQEFSFKKRKIGVITGWHTNSGNIRESKPVWNDSSSIGSEKTSISGVSSVFGEDLVEVAHPAPIFSPSIIVLGQQVSDHELGDPAPQPNSFSGGIGVLPNGRIGQVPSEVSPDDILFASNGVRELITRERQNSGTDGRISRFSYRDEELALMRIPMLTSTSKLSVDDITSEVNALTEKNGCPLGQFLSPITELSSRDSLEDSLDNGGLSSRRVIGLAARLTERSGVGEYGR